MGRVGAGGTRRPRDIPAVLAEAWLAKVRLQNQLWAAFLQ